MGSDKLDKDVALPSKLFELLRLSIKHMERLNRDTSYCMDMGCGCSPMTLTMIYVIYLYRVLLCIMFWALMQTSQLQLLMCKGVNIIRNS